MPERKFADSFEIDIEKFVDLITFHMISGHMYSEST